MKTYVVSYQTRSGFVSQDAVKAMSKFEATAEVVANNKGVKILAVS